MIFVWGKFSKNRTVNKDFFSFPASCSCPDGAQPEVIVLEITLKSRFGRDLPKRTFFLDLPLFLTYNQNADSNKGGGDGPSEGQGGEQVEAKVGNQNAIQEEKTS